MRINKIEVIPFTIPLARTFSYGAAVARITQEHVLIRVIDDAGIVGTSEATPRPAIHGETQVSCVTILRDYLAPNLIGRNPLDREGYWREFDRIAWNPTAKAGLDTAIHDLIARQLEIPLAALLGGAPEPVPISYMLGSGTPQTVLDEAVGISDRTGIIAFKVKAGADPERDLEQVKLLRRTLGDGAFLFIDANELYTPSVAARYIPRMAEFGIAMVEEPLRRSLDSDRADLARKIDVPLLGDDSVETLPAARRELVRGAVGVVGIKPPRNGLHVAQKIVHLAEAFDKPCWIGSQGVTGIGTLSSAHFAAAHRRAIPFPADLGNHLRQEDDLLESPVRIVEGKVILPAGPGSGVSIDPEKLTRYRADN